MSPSLAVPALGRRVLFIQTKGSSGEDQHFAIGAATLSPGVVSSFSTVRFLIGRWGDNLAKQGASALLDDSGVHSKFKVYALSDKRLFPFKQPVSVQAGCVTWVKVPSLIF